MRGNILVGGVSCLLDNLVKLLKQEVIGEEDYDFVVGLSKLVPAAHPFLHL